MSHTCSASCTAGWPAGRKCHCRNGCGQNFSTVGNFDKHLHRTATVLDCLPPESVGMALNAHGVWVKQGEVDFSERLRGRSA